MNAIWSIWKIPYNNHFTLSPTKEMQPTRQEMIVASAINIDWCIIVGKRHSDCLKWVHNLHLDHNPLHNEQWFYTDKFRFINREEALKLAKENWQFIGQQHWDILYSENLR